MHGRTALKPDDEMARLARLRMRLCGFTLTLAALAGVVPIVSAEDALKVLRIQPDGENVGSNAQILIEFNLPVVALGATSRDVTDVPVEIEPPVDCKWQWLNRQTLSCLLNDGRGLSLSTKYQLTIRQGLKASDGKTLGETFTQEFVTKLPKILHSEFYEWSSPTRPNLRITFDQPITRESLESRVALVGLESGDRSSAAVEMKPELLRNSRFFEKTDDGDWQAMEIANRDPLFVESLKLPAEIATRSWVVEFRDELPLDTTFELTVLAGLESVHGPTRTPNDIFVTDVVTFPEFRFVGIRCELLDGKVVLHVKEATELDSLDNRCNPRGRIGLAFSSPVLHTEIAEKVRFVPSLSGNRESYDPWEWARRTRFSNHRDRPRNYTVWLPEYVRADQHYVVEPVDSGLFDRLKRLFDDARPEAIVDVFDRPLVNSVEMDFWTRHRNASVRMPHRETVLETSIESQIPIYVTNLTSIDTKYFATTHGEAPSPRLLRHEQSLQEVKDLAFAVPLGVRDLLEGKSGAVFGEFRGNPRFEEISPSSVGPRRFFSQVTPYNIHLKVGHFDSIAWITDLTTGETIADANVAVYHTIRDAFNQTAPVVNGHTDTDGVASLPGRFNLYPDFGQRHSYDCRRNNLVVDYSDCDQVVLRIDGSEGIAILPLTSRYDLGSWPSYLPRNMYPRQLPRSGHMKVWGTTAQGIYRKGETIQYKVYVRDQNTSGLVAAAATDYRIEVIDPSGKTIHELDDVELNEFGAFHGTVKIPDNALMGWYRFVIDLPNDQRRQAFRTLVTDFTPAPVRVENHLNGSEFHNGDRLSTTTNATLFSGGPYRNAPAQVSVTLSRSRFAPDNPLLEKYGFAEFHESRVPNKKLIARVHGELSAIGDHEFSTDLDIDDFAHGRLKVESTVRDDRGRTVATESRARYFGVDRFVGIKRQRWFYHESETTPMDVIVVDREGLPVTDTRVDVKLQQNKRIAARVKSAGSAYTTRYMDSWDTIDACTGYPSKESMRCEFQFPDAGNYRAIASIKDTNGVSHATSVDFYVRGGKYVVWSQNPNYHLKLVPQSKDVKIGDTARYLIENPFPGARALVTIERYGILDQWVTTLESSTPIVEVPIKPDYVPGVYVSVLAMSPRVEKPPDSETEPRTELDLGKPSFRMGYAELEITDPHKQLIVEVRPSKEVFKPGDIVSVSLSAKPKTLIESQEPIEFAVAVLDESVLDLIGEGTSKFDPYRGFYRLAALDMSNYSLLHRLVGVQGFAKKGVSPGGDGGGSIKLRSIEKFVGYWNPSLPADSNGHAELDFKLPDNLTGWRVLALAATPSDRFGLGEGSFKSNQPTEIRAALPNQVTETDQLFAEFTVLNRTDRERTLRIQVSATGDIDNVSEPLDTTVKFNAQQRRNVGIPVSVAYASDSRETHEGRIRFEVRAWDDTDGDALLVDVPVLKRRVLQVATNFGRLDGDHLSELIQIPNDIYEDIGDIEVNLSASLVGELNGSIDYLVDYPYQCWEQQLSRAVGYAQRIELRQYLPNTESSDSLRESIAQILDTAGNYQAPGGGMAYWLPRNEYVSPYLSAYTALAFRWLRENGHQIDARVEKDLHEYLQGILRKNENSRRYTSGMLATVRAVALHALARAGKADHSDLQRFELHTKYMSGFGLAQFLEAASRLSGSSDLISDLVRQILNQSNRTSGRLMISEDLVPSFAYIHQGRQRTNCAVLSAFAGLMEDESSPVLERDVTGLARQVSYMRKDQDHWASTQDNAYCLIALADYAKKMETTQPDMRVEVELNVPPLANSVNLGDATWKGFIGSHSSSIAPLGSGYSGQTGTVDIRRKGTGPLYYRTKLTYASKAEPTDRVNLGIDIRREYSIWRNNEWHLLSGSEEINKGDLIRIDLFVATPVKRHFVVVDDAVPAGLEPMNFDLANTAEVEQDELFADESHWHSANDWNRFGKRWYGYSFYFRETGHRNVRFHAESLRPGRHHVAWFGQVVSKGEFSVAPTHVEEMYSPDVYGKSLPLKLVVE